MLQPKKPLDLSGANEILKSERPPLDLSGAESVLKKKDATVVNPKSASVTPSGSSVGKNSSGFPEIDMNSVAPGMGVQPTENNTVKQSKGKIVDLKIEKPKTRSFASEVFHKLATGSSQLGADVAAVPELLYDAFSWPQNAIADYFDIPSLKADSEKFKKTIGVRNAVKDFYKSEVSKLREESARVDKKYAAGIYDSFKNGDVADGFRQLTNSFAESLPATSTIMLGGAYTKAPQLLAASTMMFGAGKNEQLKDENPDMSTNTRVVNALGTGLAEGAFETIGSGSIGAAARGIIEREGKKKAFSILRDGLVDFYKESLKKMPIVSSVTGEGVTGWATHVTQNAIDVATGVKPQDYNVFEGGADAFIGEAFGGAVFGGGLKGLEQVANYQDKNTIKANTKKVFELQKTLNNPEIPEASQAEIHKAIDGLIKTNQQLVQKNVDHVESLHPKIKEKLLESIATIEESKNKAKEIKLDNSIPDAAKKILLDKLKEDFKEANNFKNNTLEGKTTPVDVLPLKEQDKLKRQALKELTAEQNPDGTKNITIDDAQITERANKIYTENESKQETATTETQQEAQPQAEEQKTEQEVLANNDELRDSPKISQNQEISPVEDVVLPSVDKPLSLQEENVSMDNNLRKEKQLEIINNSNPAPNSHNTWVRTVDDIKEAKDVFETAFNEGEMYPDFTVDDMKEALDSGEITIHSSRPIKNGSFVTPSRMNAEEYAGGKGSKIYSKTIKINDVAWIDESEGQYAPIKETKNAKTPPVEDIVVPSVSESKNKQNEISLSEQKTENKAETSSETVLNNQNEGTTSNDTPADGTTTTGVEPNGTQGENNSVPETVDTGSGENQTKVKKVKSVKDAVYDVHFDDNGNVSKIISPKDGREIPKFREVKKTVIDPVSKQQKEITVLQKNANYSKIEADATGGITNNKAKEERKEQVKKSLTSFEPSNEYEAALHYLAIGNGISSESSKKETGLSGKEVQWATQFKKNETLPSIERASEIITESATIPLDQTKVRNALIDILSSKKSVSELHDDVIAITEDKNKTQQEEELRTFMGSLSEKDFALVEAIMAEDSYLEELTNDEKLEYYEKQFGNEENIQRSNELDGLRQADSKPKDSTTSVQKREGEAKPSTQEKIAIADAKIDDIKNAVKGIDEIFGIKIKVDDIDGLSKQGIDIIDVIANIVKQAVAAGIHIDEAISKTVDHLKKSMDFEVDVDAVKERISPKKETQEFESKKGKKSLLGRLTTGGNSDAITEALQELSPNYDVRNQEKADAEAKAFVDKVGIAEALHAAKNYLIPNIDVRMLVYDEALTRLKDEIDSEVQKHPEDRDALIKQFQELSDAFDNEVRNMGQGLAILNYIYNKNQSLKYNLKKLIADYKSKDPNGEIPAEVKAKYEELTQKLKDLEEKTKVAEERAKKAEDELAIKNIQEDIERKKLVSKTNKAKAKVLANKIRESKIHKPGIFSSATPASLVWDGAVELVAKSIESGGTIADAIEIGLKYIRKSDWYKKLNNSQKQEAENTFNDTFNNVYNNSVEVTISIGKDGKIKIPAQLFRDLVEQGHNDIDEIAQIIKESIAEEYPDVELRDIRDALTGYGKQINPNKDEITRKINQLKEYGRLLSAYEDVTNGEMPKKSGLKRLKPEQKARELRRKINRLAKELNVEPIDLEKQWASALDKIKSNLKNQIEDLDKQIANGEKRKVERTTTPLDAEAVALKELRDAKKQVLDDLVGKPELTEEQKIARAEAALEKSIASLQEDIDTNNIAYKEKPTPATSAKLEELRAKKKALLEAKKELREAAGLVEEQRLKVAKNRIKNQIEDLKTRIANKDFAKKEVKPLTADDELNSLRAEKEMIYEEFEKQKYLQELQNRSFGKKFADEALESLGLLRHVKASLDLGLIGIQLRGFTYAELLRNPVELGRKFVRMFGAIGSQSKTNKAMANIIGHPLYHLAKKLDIGITHPDLRNEVREELASGNLLHFIWSLPVEYVNFLDVNDNKITDRKRKTIADTFIDAAKKQYNKLAKNGQLEIKEKDKFSIAEQWRNVNAFEAVERGLSTYGNQLRFEEFLRGVERLKAQGKDEINHPEHYEALASYIRTFSGRAKPGALVKNQKLLNVFFFSFRNATSIFQQLNPYYMLYELNKPNFKDGIYKPTVAGKMAMATMFKSVASTSATLLFLMAAYNAMKDDDDEEATIETDPRSSDFGKFKIGNFRYDPWGGYVPLITLYARLFTEESKKSDGTVYKFGEERFGVQSSGDAMAKFLFNKESPGAQAVHHYLFSTEKIDETTGESYRVNSFGQKLSEDEAYSLSPIFIGSVRDAVKNDYEGVQMFLTAYSALGLGNVQYYKSKEGATPEESFMESQAKKKALYELPESEKEKNRGKEIISSAEGDKKFLEEMAIAKSKKLPYYISQEVVISKEDVQEFDLSNGKKSVEEINNFIKEIKNKYKIKDK